MFLASPAPFALKGTYTTLVNSMNVGVSVVIVTLPLEAEPDLMDIVELQKVLRDLAILLRQVHVKHARIY